MYNNNLYNSRIKGNNVTSMVPNDPKTWVYSKSQLLDLGVGNYVAFTFYDKMKVSCALENEVWEWREALPDEEGLRPFNFTYPSPLIIANVDYSGKEYNFFKVTNVTAENLPQIVQIENIGGANGYFKQFNTVTNKFEFYTFDSDSIQISLVNNVFRLELPSSGVEGAIPSLRANQDYSPTYQDFLNYYVNVYLANGGTPLANGDPFEYKGEGTQVKPYTDTRTFIFEEPNTAPTVSPNTSVVNLMEAYVGTGTRFAPQNSGKFLIVEDTVSFYYYVGDFNYNNLYIDFRGSITCVNSGWLVDMDNPTYFDGTNSYIRMYIAKDKLFLYDQSLGFRNSGNSVTSPTPFTTGKTLVFGGEGLMLATYNGPDILTRYVFNTNGNWNDSQGHFDIRCFVRADYQGIYKCDNNGRMTFYNQLQSGVYLGSVNLNLKAFHMTGGLVRFFEKGAIAISSETSGRNYGVTFEPAGAGLGGNCTFGLNQAIVTGNCHYCFVKLNDHHVNFYAFNSPSGYGFSTSPPGSTVPMYGLFKNLGATKWNVDMKNCTFSYTGVDFDDVDFTQGNNVSSVNYFGNLIVESLVRYPYRRDGGSNTLGNLFLPKYSKFLNMNGSMVESDWYVDIML